MVEQTDPWRPTHRTLGAGARAWQAPDPAAASAPTLDADLDVVVLEQLPYGWTKVRCANGWETWVSATSLVALGAPVAAPGQRRPSTAPLITIALMVLGVSLVVLPYLLRGDPTSSVARTVSIFSLVAGGGMYLLGLVGISRPTRLRPVFDIARAAVAVVGVVALGRITSASAPVAVLAVAFGAGVIAGVAEGALTRVTAGSDGRLYTRRAVLPMAVTAIGLLGGVAAALGDAPTLVKAGQVVGIVGVGLGLGLPLGRSTRSPSSPPATHPVPAVGALLIALVVSAAIASSPVLLARAALAAPQQDVSTDLDGTYTGTFTGHPVGSSIGGDSVVTANEISLIFEKGKLTGTVVFGVKNTFPPPLEFEGQFPTCGVSRATFDGSEATVTTRSDGAIEITGSSPVSIVGTAYATAAEQNADPCTGGVDLGFGTQSVGLSVTLTEDGMTGTWGDGSPSTGGEALPFTASRSGGAPTGTSPPSSERESTGTTLAKQPAEVAAPPVTSTNPPTIPPADAAAGGAAVAGTLAAVGAVSAVEAGSGGDGPPAPSPAGPGPGAPAAETPPARRPDDPLAGEIDLLDGDQIAADPTHAAAGAEGSEIDTILDTGDKAIAAAGGDKTGGRDINDHDVNVLLDASSAGMSGATFDSGTSAPPPPTGGPPKAQLEVPPLPEGATRTVEPDGTVRDVAADGSVRQIKPDGTQQFFSPDGTVHKRLPDGTVKTMDPDGEIRTVTPSGETTVAKPDGTTGIIDDEGVHRLKLPDGTLENRYPNGMVATKTVDGTVTVWEPDGKITITYPNQTTEVIPPPGQSPGQ